MKSLIVIAVSLIAVVFSVAEGQNFPAEPGELEVPNVEAKLLRPDGTDFTNFIQHEANRQQERKGNKTMCKPKTICVLLGGSCVTTAKLCSGRLIQGCKGRKCQCCVPDVLGAKFENLEQELQSLKSNLSSGIQSLNLNFSSELQSLKDNTQNLNLNLSSEIQSLKDNTQNMNLNISLKIQSLKDNTQNMNLNISSELQYIKDNTQNINSNLSSGIQSLKDNTQNMNLTLSSKLSDLNTKLSNVNSSIHSKLASLATTQATTTTTTTTTTAAPTTTAQGCSVSQGEFKIGEQCFKMNFTRMSWSSARSYCQGIGLDLAQPEHPWPVHQYIKQKGWMTTRTWIGLRGTGSCYEWLNGTCIPNASPLWVRWGMEGDFSSSWSINIHDQTSSSDIGKPLDVHGSTDTFQVLCERK